MRISKTDMLGAFSAAVLVDAALMLLPNGSAGLAVPFIIGFVGIAISMLITPSGIHGQLEPRLWTVGPLVNTAVFYFVIQGVNRILRSRSDARSR
jgi:hypothetical protein